MNSIETIKTAELLYAARFAPTRQFYLLKPQGRLCAVLFAERDAFEGFAARSKERDIHINATEHRLEDREMFFIDLWRCGVEDVWLMGSDEYVPLTSLFTPPAEDKLPPDQRQVPHPDLTGKILWVMQNVRLGTATAEMEIDMLRKLKTCRFFGAAIPNEDGSFAIPVIQQEKEDGTKDDKRLVLLFSDLREFMTVFKDEKLRIRYFDFEEMCALVEHEFDAVVINYASGAPLMLDREILETAKQL